MDNDSSRKFLKGLKSYLIPLQVLRFLNVSDAAFAVKRSVQSFHIEDKNLIAFEAALF